MAPIKYYYDRFFKRSTINDELEHNRTEKEKCKKVKSLQKTGMLKKILLISLASGGAGLYAYYKKNPVTKPEDKLLKYGKSPYVPVTIHTYNKKVTIQGIWHDKKLFSKYKDYFKNIISQNDAVVIESTVTGEFYLNSYFSKIGKIAKKNNKRVFSVDPINVNITVTDFVLGGAGLLLSVDGVSDNLIYIYERRKGNNIDRRKFIIQNIRSIFGASLFLGSIPGLFVRNLISSKRLNNYGIDDILFLGSTDYRNIQIAHGVIKILSEEKEIKNLILFHGGNHSDGISKYLTNPSLRLKKILYLPYQLFGETWIREFNLIGNKWLIKKQKYLF